MIEPVLEVGEQRDRFVVARDAEEVACLGRRVRADAFAQRRFEVVVDAQDVLRLQPSEVLGHGSVGTLVPFLRTRCRRELRQPAIALLLETQGRVRPCQLALQQHHFLVPGERDQVHVPQAPVVGFLAHA